MDLQSFDWGWMDKGEGLFHKEAITGEIFRDKLYEQFFEVQEGDIVLDVGASIGPFTYSILDKNPSKVICVEPSPVEHPTLEKNTQNGPVTIIKKALTPNDGEVILNEVFGMDNHLKEEVKLEGISFDTLLKENDLDRIDFLKTDCEGGEYSIFTLDNFCWLKDNLGVAVGEWHLSTPELKQQFRIFRDVFLRLFPNHKVYSVDGVNIKWDLWNEHFIEYYNEVIIYIDNKK
jgi:FkbM family methyltransferase